MNADRSAYALLDAAARAAFSPSTFRVPTTAERASLRHGDLAKLIFDFGAAGVERMWVRVEAVLDDGAYRGALLNSALCGLAEPGDAVRFDARHVADLGLEGDV